MSDTISLKKTSIALLISSSIFAAHAQQSQENGDVSELEEVVVTATKRSQTLQEVPVSVSVVDGQKLEDANIRDLIDLQSISPSLRAVQLQNTTSTDFFIRGFGNGGSSIGVENAVGVYIDGVYRSRLASQLSDLPSLERIEVLKGPQSSLFGKNASAGVINIITKKPDFNASGYVQAGISNYGGNDLRAYTTGPVSDKLAYSIGGNYTKRDGFVDNIHLGTDINDRDRFAVRSQLLFEANQDTEFRLIADYDKIDEKCCFTANLINGPTGFAVNALGGQVPSSPFDYKAALNNDPKNIVENAGISFHADVDFEHFKLTSITAYRDNESESSVDVDFTSADIIVNNRQLDYSTFTQELRLSSNDDESRFSWLVGGLFFDEDLKQSDDILYGSSFGPYMGALAGSQTVFSAIELLTGNAPGTFFRAGNGSRSLVGQDNQAITLFGNVDFDITDKLTATLGLSYTKDEKEAFVREDNTAFFSNTDLFGANGGILTQFFPTTVLGALSTLQFLPSVLDFPNAVEDGKSDDDNVDYTFRLSYALSDNANIYFNHATGYKATSWNLTSNTRPSRAAINALFPTGGAPFNLTAGSRFAEPEEAELFEIGYKASYSNASIYVSIFDQSVENFQSNTFVGNAFTLINAEEQTARGIEIESVWQPTNNLTISFSGAYIDAEYDSFLNSEFGDISGTQVGNVNEYSASIGAKYNFNISGNDAFVSVDYQYENEVETEDGSTINPQNVALLAAGEGVREVSTVNMAAGISIDNIDVSLWARNLFNDEYIIQNIATPIQPGSFNGYPNAPHIYGLDIRYKF